MTRDPRVATTAEVLEARGACTRRTLYLDRRAGLFDGLLPRRTSSGSWSCNGVWLEWPVGALRRARLIRRELARGRTRDMVAAALLAGELS